MRLPRKRSAGVIWADWRVVLPIGLITLLTCWFSIQALQDYSNNLQEAQVRVERLKSNASKISIIDNEWRTTGSVIGEPDIRHGKQLHGASLDGLIINIRRDALALCHVGIVAKTRPWLWTSADIYTASIVKLHRLYASGNIRSAHSFDDATVVPLAAELQTLLDLLRDSFGAEAEKARQEAAIGTLAVLLALFTAVVLVGKKLTRSRESAAAQNAQTRTIEMSERRLGVLIGNVNAVVMVLDREGNLAYVSQQADRFFGFVPKVFQELLNPCLDDAPLLDLVRRGEGDAEVILDFDGESREFKVSCRSLFEDEAVQGQVLVWHDVTLAYEAQRAIEKARDSAFELSRLKSEFLANMSHEIRTPMNGVLGMADLLFDTDLTDTQEEYVETIHTCGTSLMTILNDILDFSKIESGHLIIENISFNPALVADEAASVLRAQALRKGIEIVVKADEVDIVMGDPTRIRQVLLNLITNAVKFTDKGSVLVSVDRIHEEDRIARVRFSVTDTGIGIPEERLEAIFSMFTQVDGSTTRLYGGTGLGLTISKQLVQMMGGNLQVKSKIGEGSQFWFELQLGQAVQSGDSVLEGLQKLYSNTRSSSQPRQLEIPQAVLVVEDNEVNQAVAERLLTRMGCTVDVVSSGMEALNLVRSNKYDVIFMDCLMPGIDGFGTTRRMRASEEEWLKSVRIIALTASAMEGDMDRCLDAGMDDYIPKPINGEILFQMLDKTWVRDAA